MDTISLKLPAALKQRLAAEAKRRSVTQSTIVRESLEQSLAADTSQRGKLTCADLAADLVGSVRGPRDLSTNKRYLQEAILKDHARRRKRPR
jgi:hypothetical protein